MYSDLVRDLRFNKSWVHGIIRINVSIKNENDNSTPVNI